MSRLIVLALLALPVAAQISLTFSQQGASSLVSIAGKKVRGLGVAGVTLCSHDPSARTIHPEQVWEAAGSLGISYILPAIGGVTLDRSRAFSWPQLLLDGADWASQGAGLAGVAKIIKMPNGIAAGLTVGGPLIFGLLKSKLPKALPVDVSAQIVTRDLPLLPGGCASGFMLYRYAGDWLPRKVDIP